MRVLTHWISPLQESPGDIYETIARVKAATPPKWRPAVVVPAVYGAIWQANRTLRNTLHMDLRPQDPQDLGWIRDRFAEADVLCGAWGVPRELTEWEGYEHGAAAEVVDLYCLDLEPYTGFLVEPDRDPDQFIAAFASRTGKRPWISVVPQASGIDPLGAAWRKWAAWAVGVRPQCYWTDGEQLAPETALPYLSQRIKRAKVKAKRVVPIYPANGGLELRRLLARARSDRDIWVLA